MHALFSCSPDLRSVVLPDGAVILEQEDESIASSFTDRYILEHLRMGETYERIALELMSLGYLDSALAYRAVELFANSLLSRRLYRPLGFLAPWESTNTIAQRV